MKQKKRTQIIFEKHEITRIRVTRRSTETAFDPTKEQISVDSTAIEKPVASKTRWREKLRGFWKQNR